MKLVLTGATGFTGGEVLRQALADPAIERIAVLTRRPLGRSHPKLDEILIENFLDYSGIDFASYDACIWCLGISQAGVSEATYIEITHDYTVAAAEAMFAANPALRFCFLSGRGADQDEQARSLFGRIKGRTERRLAEFGRGVTSFRPAYIRPTRATGPRRDFARFLTPIGSAMAWFNDDLAPHGWTEPIERVLAAARCNHVPIAVPRPWESMEPKKTLPATPWWPTLPWQSAKQKPVLSTMNGEPLHKYQTIDCRARDEKPSPKR